MKSLFICGMGRVPWLEAELVKQADMLHLKGVQ